MTIVIFLVLQITTFLAVFSQIDAILITKPQDTEVLVNQSTYFNCSTLNTTYEIVWFHYAVGRYERNDVYEFGEIKYDYRERFDIEIDGPKGVYNLIIRRPNLNDAGRYECQDFQGTQDKASAQLVVLAKIPVYQSNAQLCGVIGPNSCDKQPDKLQLTCTVDYNGNIPPQMQWRKDNFTIREGGTQITFANSVTYTLSIDVDLHMSNSFYVYETSSFAENQYSCRSPIFNIYYNFRFNIGQKQKKNSMNDKKYSEIKE